MVVFTIGGKQEKPLRSAVGRFTRGLFPFPASSGLQRTKHVPCRKLRRCARSLPHARVSQDFDVLVPCRRVQREKTRGHEVRVIAGFTLFGVKATTTTTRVPSHCRTPKGCYTACKAS